MRFQPHTPAEIKKMLAAIGVTGIDALFEDIPEALRLKRPLDIPKALDEQALIAHLKALESENGATRMRASFLGAGLYEHYIPQAVDHMLLRGEYLTSYTPYQAELSQGTLKAVFEFQTMIAELLSLDMANASMYDGAHAATEALLMGLRVRPKAKRVLVSAGVHPDYRAVAETYFQHRDEVIETLPLRDGVTDLKALAGQDLSDVGAVLVQSPNFFGNLEDVAALAERCRASKVPLAQCFNEPLAFGIVAPPGEVGATIAVGEAQALGVAPGFGGPSLGIFACEQSFMRRTPGRLVAQTTDIEGREAYVLTLSTREQHIRRERATSNICTNQGLMALAATIYLSLLGKQGLIELARVNLSRATYAREQLRALPGVEPAFDQPFFNEFTVRLPVPAAGVVKHAAAQGVVAGLDLGRFDATRADQLLVAVTELQSRDDIDQLVTLVGEAL